MVKKYSKKKSITRKNKKKHSKKKSKNKVKKNSKNNKQGGHIQKDNVSLRQAVSILRAYYIQHLI